jgi:DNA-binding transcriptional regulator YhcF (GntR family)
VTHYEVARGEFRGELEMPEQRQDTPKMVVQKGGKRPHRSQLRRELDRKRVSELLLMGETSARQIAAKIGLSASTVRRDLQALRAEWRIERLQDQDEWVARQIQELSLTIRSAWEGWARSQEPTKKQSMRSKGFTKKPGSKQGGRVQIRPEDILEFEQVNRSQTSSGDPRFLEIVERCLAARARLLGMNQPVKIAPTDPSGTRPYEDARGELLRRINSVAENVAVPLPLGVGQSGDHTGQTRFQRVLPPGSPEAIKQVIKKTEGDERSDRTGESGEVEVEILPPDFEIKR